MSNAFTVAYSSQATLYNMNKTWFLILALIGHALLAVTQSAAVDTSDLVAEEQPSDR